MEEEETIPEISQEKISSAQAILREPFNFYTMSLELNSENRIDIMNNQYNRLLEKQIIESTTMQGGIMIELKSVRKMISEFKKTEEVSQKKMMELNTKVQMAKEET